MRRRSPTILHQSRWHGSTWGETCALVIGQSSAWVKESIEIVAVKRLSSTKEAFALAIGAAGSHRVQVGEGEC